MKTMKSAVAANGNHESWLPLIEVAAREVFELMLSSQLTLPEPEDQGPPYDVTSMVGLSS